MAVQSGESIMRWQGRRGSGNIEDRRAMSTGRGAGIGGVGLLAVVVIGYFLGIDVTPLLDGAIAPQGGGEVTAEDQEQAKFVSVVLADTEAIWSAQFTAAGRSYQPPVLVLYKGVTQSPCGGASGATGPFYCPGDQKVYLDTAFFATMARQLGAKGDFAAAYVVAHEVAHHVQDELGILGQANDLRTSASPAQANAISVRIELQADCLAGVWARSAEERFGTLEPGDIAEAMDAAERIGDDTLQKNAGQVPMPESFTHGTSAQRQRWFSAGYDNPAITSCDTFGADQL